MATIAELTLGASKGRPASQRHEEEEGRRGTADTRQE